MQHSNFYSFWRSLPDHRRSVAASLVQAAYILEFDRQEKREEEEHEALAPPWWEFFHYKLIRQLVDDVDSSIFGAIFEFNPPVSAQNPTTVNAPRFVVAFRGTIITKESVNRDFRLDFSIVQNALHKTSRCMIAVQSVQNLISEVRSLNIWLAGHSLGSAIATITGKNLAKSGIFLDAFLFNPPFFSAPIEMIRDAKIKSRIQMSGSLIRAGLSVVLKAEKLLPDRDDSFAVLSSWVPCLFVNPSDHICSGYIDYFQRRRNMEEIGAGNIQRLATQNSIRCLFLSAIGKESDPYHLLPSANLTVNSSSAEESLMEAHALHQWWKLDMHLQTARYEFRRSCIR